MVRFFLLASLLVLIPIKSEAKECQTLAEARADHPTAHLRYTQVGERKCWYKGSHIPASEFRSTSREDVRNVGNGGIEDRQPSEKDTKEDINEIDLMADEETMRLRFEGAAWDDATLAKALKGISW